MYAYFFNFYGKIYFLMRSSEATELFYRIFWFILNRFRLPLPRNELIIDNIATITKILFHISGKYIPSAFPFGVLHKYQGKKPKR